MSTFDRLSFIILALFGLSGCGQTVADEPAPPPISADVIYGHKLGTALMLDVYSPAEGSAPRFDVSEATTSIVHR